MAITAPQNAAIENSGRIELFAKLLGSHQQFFIRLFCSQESFRAN